MCEQYQHLLIAEVDQFVPTSQMVSSFLSDLIDGGFLPTPVELVLRVPTGEVRRFTNPFTGEIDLVPRKAHHKLDRVSDIAVQAGRLRDYEAVASGFGTPLLAALPVSTDDPYFLGVTCRASSSLRSTSHFVPQDPGQGQLAFAAPVEDSIDFGVFTNPHDGSNIEVPNAGSARFWIEIELGKFMFPEIHDSLELLHPKIVSMAERNFGVRFSQGCKYG